VFVRSSKLASWTAILSLVFSSVLTLTHNHGQSCDCLDGSHAHSSSPSVIAGLESLPLGDCDCSDCELPQSQNENQDHDEDSCSICRMVFEHGQQTIEFELSDNDEELCTVVAFVVDAPCLGAVSEYLTRGPPA
jgi:hypothetical protein